MLDQYLGNILDCLSRVVPPLVPVPVKDRNKLIRFDITGLCMHREVRCRASVAGSPFPGWRDTSCAIPGVLWREMQRLTTSRSKNFSLLLFILSADTNQYQPLLLAKSRLWFQYLSVQFFWFKQKSMGSPFNFHNGFRINNSCREALLYPVSPGWSHLFCGHVASCFHITIV